MKRTWIKQPMMVDTKKKLVFEFPNTKGILNLKSSKNETHFVHQFKIEIMPQEINECDIKF
jgi:hypothetical protein